MNSDSIYDIFSGHHSDDAMWIEAIDGLGAATERMRQLARKKPGRYFLFDCSRQTVITVLETHDDSGEKWKSA